MAIVREHPLERLLLIMKDREISVTRDDIEWAFHSPATRKEVVRWVERDLVHETLLTHEELQLYSKLQANGQLRDIQAYHDVSGIVPLGDNQLRVAIAALEASTANINRHACSIQEQRLALESLQARQREERDHRARAEASRRRAQASEKQDLCAESEDLSGSLNDQVQRMRKGLSSRDISLKGVVAEVLRKNDRILSCLEASAMKIEPTHSSDDRLARKVETLCDKLDKLVIEEIHQRLDRIFLESLSIGNDKYDIQTVEEGAKAGEQFGAQSEEMATLYSEISTVAKMSLNQEYRGALQQRLHLRKERAACESQSTMNHIKSSLKHMTQQVEVLVAYAHGHRSLTVASNKIESLIAEHLNHRIERPAIRISPGQTHATQADAVSPDNIVAHRLLRGLAIPLDAEVDPQNLDMILMTTTAEGIAKIADMAARLDGDTENLIAIRLCEAEKSLALLLEQVYINTPGSEVRLLNRTLEEGIAGLDRKVSALGAAMGQLETIPAVEDGKNRAIFETGWA